MVTSYESITTVCSCVMTTAHVMGCSLRAAMGKTTPTRMTSCWRSSDKSSSLCILTQRAQVPGCGVSMYQCTHCTRTLAYRTGSLTRTRSNSCSFIEVNPRAYQTQTRTHNELCRCRRYKPRMTKSRSVTDQTRTGG